MKLWKTQNRKKKDRFVGLVAYFDETMDSIGGY